jgi:hypothetical protein
VRTFCGIVIGQEVIFTNEKEIYSHHTLHYPLHMIEFILASVLSNAQAHAIQNQEQVNKICAYIVGIPYASDNFSDEEWERFKFCRQLISKEVTNAII